MKIFRRLYSSVPLLIIGGLIVKTQICIGDGCTGMVQAILFVFLSLIYLLTLLVILIVSVIKDFKNKVPLNFYPLLTTLIILVAVALSFNSDKFKSPAKLYARMESMGGISRNTLTLKQNGKFVITMRQIEWSCFYKGHFQINNDTLMLLKNDIQILTDSLFADKYLIDDNQKILFPLDKSDFRYDTTRWLTIIEGKE